MQSALEIKELIGTVEYLTANNVFNHTNDLIDFLIGVKLILKESRSFVFEFPYWYSQISNNRFDRIYHECSSYFTVCSLNNISDISGLYIDHMGFIDTYGGSLRIIEGLEK